MCLHVHWLAEVTWAVYMQALLDFKGLRSLCAIKRRRRSKVPCVGLTGRVHPLCHQFRGATYKSLTGRVDSDNTVEFMSLCAIKYLRRPVPCGSAQQIALASDLLQSTLLLESNTVYRAFVQLKYVEVRPGFFSKQFSRGALVRWRIGIHMKEVLW